MKYFCTDEERVGTCYHEFMKGRSKAGQFWKKDSLLIHDDIHCRLGLAELIGSVIENYSPFEDVKVTKIDWDRICAAAYASGGEIKQAICEANSWVENTFQEHDYFTMAGI